jgi:hypothetical protein
MKHIFILIFTLIFSMSFYAQDYMDKITKQACDCLDGVDENLGTEKLTLKLGLCVIDAAAPYKKQLKKDHKLDLDKIDEEGHRLGTMIGVKMASICPDKLLMFSEISSEEEEIMPYESKIVQGEILRIDEDLLVTFHLKDDFGKIMKFYWATFIDSPYEMTLEYKTLVGKTVVITYEPTDIFDARIGEYRTFNIISRID